MRDFTTRAFLSRIGQATRPVTVTPTRRPFAEAPEPVSRRRLVQTVLTLITAVVIATIALVPPSVTASWLREALRMARLGPAQPGQEGEDDIAADTNAYSSRRNGAASPQGLGDGESRDMPAAPPQLPPSTSAAATAPSLPAPASPKVQELTVEDDSYDATHVPPAPAKPKGPYTIAERLTQFAPTAIERLQPAFKKAGIAFPPVYATLVGLKEEKRLQLYAAGADKKYALIKTYAIRAASGGQGPKLREGDGQVPEGLYRVELLNPNSSYHLSLRVNYPSDYDRDRAKEDGRDKLGGDIMIHGRAVSIGCLAMGDRAIEEIFVLGGRMARLENFRILLAPWDFRTRSLEAAATDADVSAALAKSPKWTPQLYDRIRTALAKYPLPAAASPAPAATQAVRTSR
ncbi:MAG TPA: L,D-transpeptidase family protein [Candidatus Methylacidiphilales bacterium]|nr:L,D-transpeptidase family protein [Candidatus Methylacidiphilales bacterium]